jgi:hypothetical protein
LTDETLLQAYALDEPSRAVLEEKMAALLQVPPSVAGNLLDYTPRVLYYKKNNAEGEDERD